MMRSYESSWCSGSFRPCASFDRAPLVGLAVLVHLCVKLCTFVTGSIGSPSLWMISIGACICATCVTGEALRYASGFSASVPPRCQT